MLTSPAYIKILLNKHGFKIKKKFGQNFITEPSIIDNIVEAANLTKNDTVIEIGPGLGVLTRALADRAGKVYAIEIDKNLIPLLEETLTGHENIEIINQDALTLNFDQLINGDGTDKYKVVANLPYYITTPLIMHFLENRFRVSEMVVMVQKEVAQRMVASPGGKDYGALSVAVQYYTAPRIEFKVPPQVFLPRPEVESAVISLRILEQPPISVKDEKNFFRVVKAAFGQRRKTLLNALHNGGFDLDKESLTGILQECSIDPKRRGETLSLEEFAALSNRIAQ